MNYETNWFIQEHLGRIEHAELIEGRTRTLPARLKVDKSPRPREREGGKSLLQMWGSRILGPPLQN